MNTRKRKFGYLTVVVATLAMMALIAGCQPSSNSSDDSVSSVDAQYFAFYSSSKAYVSAADYVSNQSGGLFTFAPSVAMSAMATASLYLTDTYSGKVYSFDPSTHLASASSLAATSKNSSGEIAFYKGIGYVAVGSGSGAGVYFFDPSASAPSMTSVGSFVPVDGTAGDNYQDVVIGSDSFLYAANGTDGTVVKVDPATDTIVATYAMSKSGTTGLAIGTYNGVSGIFAANTGGSIDFVAQGAASGTAATVITTSVDSPIYPGRLVQLANGNLVATGYDTSWANHTYLVTLSGTGSSVSEIKASGAAFGSLDIAYRGGLVYVPVGDYASKSSKLYVFDASGAMETYSPVSVMTESDLLTNIAFYEN